MEKKEELLPQLLAYAGKRKVLTYLSMVIAGISQLLALAPFLYIWAILRDVIAGDYSRIAHYGWMAVAFAIASIVIIIAHRMRTVAGADKIVVLKEGKVDECGSPSELIASGGFYKRMQDLQRNALDWNI